MNRQEKAQVIERLHERAGRATFAVVTDFKGLSVEEMTQLRAKLREVNVDYQVVKNTLARRAIKDTELEPLVDHFKENCAIALGYDEPVDMAKALADFAKAMKKKKFKLKLGCLEGKILDEEGVKAISKLPSRPELLGMMLGTMNAVPTNFVSLLANVPRGLLNVLTAVKDQKENA